MSAYSLGSPLWDIWTADFLPTARTQPSYWAQKDNAFTREVPLPGYAPNDVAVTTTPGSGILTVKAQRPNASKTMTIYLPTEADENSVQAVMKDGMLTLTASTLVPVVKTIQVTSGE